MHINASDCKRNTENKIVFDPFGIRNQNIIKRKSGENEHPVLIVIQHDKSFQRHQSRIKRIEEKTKGEQTVCTHSIFVIAMNYNLMLSFRFGFFYLTQCLLFSVKMTHENKKQHTSH